MRKCKKCKIDFPLNDKYFYVNKTSPSNLDCVCIECRKIQASEYRKLNIEKNSNCKKLWYHRNKERVLKKRKEYYQENQDVIKDRIKQYCLINKDIVKQQKKDYYNRIKTNPEFKIKCRLRVIKWRLRNPQKAREQGYRRRMNKKNVGGFHTLFEWQVMKKRYNYTCPICGKKEPEIILTRDHVIPITKWDEWLNTQNKKKVPFKCNDIWNIQPLCLSCNSKKGVKISEFYKSNKNDFSLLGEMSYL